MTAVFSSSNSMPHSLPSSLKGSPVIGEYVHLKKEKLGETFHNGGIRVKAIWNQLTNIWTGRNENVSSTVDERCDCLQIDVSSKVYMRTKLKLLKLLEFTIRKHNTGMQIYPQQMVKR